ncbi:MAG: hypothetical protein VZR00_04055 [Lachnospiraceae bacterium]|jgi:hypothetical protein|nr:hypothetical protein [Lachnospiraceae bacterium]MEE3461052.1 hypothetical protein [Lachnospiraceae bacterium]
MTGSDVNNVIVVPGNGNELILKTHDAFTSGFLKHFDEKSNSEESKVIDELQSICKEVTGYDIRIKVQLDEDGGIDDRDIVGDFDTVKGLEVTDASTEEIEEQSRKEHLPEFSEEGF